MQSTAAETEKRQSTRHGKFYIIDTDIRGGGPGHGVVLANESKLLTPPRLIIRPEAGGFPPLAENPHLVYDPAQGSMPRDLEASLSGYWLVSKRFKEALASVDPDGFAFVPCIFTLPDGTEGPQHFLCDALRELDAVDEAKSKLRVIESADYENGKYYRLGGAVDLAFKSDVLGSAHAFRTPYSGDFVFCDWVLRDAIGGHGFTGVRFIDITQGN
ncbi:DUF1629 domain-containing protein [Lysobacter yananisis]|uniref:DUF1629 domain-containing protein n=1 Tax=Lysobacter yananisis TaxID=1003114 RepID=A0ABY9P6C5_9GAMM|nr:DUF1629 domain-containing protein [Lysobacter yananisis]WMT01407.1 DUF1629 domain-containing protein [Lysobacter yananisis]